MKKTNFTILLLIFSLLGYTQSTLTYPPGTIIHNSKASSKKFVGSPSITVLKDGTYIASHDYFGKFLSDAFIYESKDRGETWNRIAEIKGLNWGALFTRGKELYLIGVRPKGNAGYGDCVIMKSLDGGHSWTSPTDSKNGLLFEGFYHTAPVPVVFHKGKIWKAIEVRDKVDGWGKFKALMLSVKEKANLLDASNWITSNVLDFDNSILKNSQAWLEGNAVVAKDKSIKNILRLHYMKDDKAAVLKVSTDGKTISLNSPNEVVDLPGACKKFTIRYDKKTKKYWTLSNYVLNEYRNDHNERNRNTIVLAYSEDLINWQIKDTLLHHPDVNNYGFQYLDWLIEGKDIIAVSRTAWEDETGKADNQHNANFLTFHRFKDFRKKQR